MNRWRRSDTLGERRSRRSFSGRSIISRPGTRDRSADLDRATYRHLSCEATLRPRSRAHQLESRGPVSWTTFQTRRSLALKLDKRVVIYRLGSLGDTVAALPCFHLIERAFPDAERLVLTNIPVSSKAAPLETILRDGGFIHGAIAYPLGLRDPLALARLAAKLRTLRADTLVYLTRPRGMAATRRDVAYFRLCGFRRIIGAPRTRDLQDHRIDARGDLERESLRLGRTLAALGAIDFADRTWWDLRLTKSERSQARAALAPLGARPFIVVNTGGKAAEKDWGVANWASLLTGLASPLAEHGLVFVGAGEDSERGDRLRPCWSAAPVLDLCGKVAPRESAAVIERASLFIGHDSGPLHLADAVGTPCLGLFGNYNAPKMWHPSGADTHIIHRMEGLSTIAPTEVIGATLGIVRAGRSLAVRDSSS
jgi:heptosyltransferase-3